MAKQLSRIITCTGWKRSWPPWTHARKAGLSGNHLTCMETDSPFLCSEISRSQTGEKAGTPASPSVPCTAPVLLPPHLQECTLGTWGACQQPSSQDRALMGTFSGSSHIEMPTSAHHRCISDSEYSTISGTHIQGRFQSTVRKAVTPYSKTDID